MKRLVDIRVLAISLLSGSSFMSGITPTTAESWEPVLKSGYFYVDKESVAIWEKPESNPRTVYIGAIFKIGETQDHIHYGYRINVEQCLRFDSGELDGQKIEGLPPKNVAEFIRAPVFRMVGRPLRPKGLPSGAGGAEGWTWKRGGSLGINVAGEYLCDTAKNMKLGERFGFK